MNKYDKERALCEENIAKCNKQIAIWRKRKAEWLARKNNADKDEKLDLISKSGFDDPDKLAEKLGVKRDEGSADDPKKDNHENTQSPNQNNTTTEKEST